MVGKNGNLWTIGYGSTLDFDNAIQRKYVIFRYLIIVLSAVLKLCTLFKSRVSCRWRLTGSLWTPRQSRRRIELPWPSIPTSLCERKLRRKIEPSKNLSQSNHIENFLKQVFVYHESWSMIGANHLHNYFDWIIVLEQKSFKPGHNLHCKLNLFDFSKWNWVQKLKKIYHLMAWEMSLKMVWEML